MFYVYEWYIKETGEIIYVGKGCRNRYKVRKHNRLFNEMIKRYDCESRIIKTFESESEAFEYEYERIVELKSLNQCVCNINKGGSGGTVEWWTDEMRKKYSESNVMKSEAQRKRMSENNPMKNKDIAYKRGKKKRRKVVINGKLYDGLKIAAKELNVAEYTVLCWCKKGYDTYGNPCRYADEKQKPYSEFKRYNPKATNLRPVLVDGKRFMTMTDAASYLGTTIQNLSYHMKRSGICKGHKCEYDNQQPSQVNFDNSILEGSTTNE